jgi:hypothetical protein
LRRRRCSGPIETAKTADPWLLAALFLACSVFGSPYLMSYDLLPLTFAAILLRATGRLDMQGQRLAVLVYWLPLNPVRARTVLSAGRIADRAQPSRFI